MLAKFLKTPFQSTLYQVPVKNFCIYEAYLNPKMHIYMNHNPTNMYEDYYTYGEFPRPLRYPTKMPSERYTNEIMAVLHETFDEHFVSH